jgi:hypothetical protein
MAQRTRKTNISVEELPQPHHELTNEEAEAAKGGRAAPAPKSWTSYEDTSYGKDDLYWDMVLSMP